MKIEQLDEFSKKKFSSVDLMHDLDGQPHTISHTQSPQSGLFHFWPEFFFSFFINFSLDISLRVNERILWPSAGALIFKTTSLIFSLTLINLCKLLRSFFSSSPADRRAEESRWIRKFDKFRHFWSVRSRNAVECGAVQMKSKGRRDRDCVDRDQ